MLHDGEKIAGINEEDITVHVESDGESVLDEQRQPQVSDSTKLKNVVMEYELAMVHHLFHIVLYDEMHLTEEGLLPSGTPPTAENMKALRDDIVHSVLARATVPGEDAKHVWVHRGDEYAVMLIEEIQRRVEANQIIDVSRLSTTTILTPRNGANGSGLLGNEERVA